MEKNFSEIWKEHTETDLYEKCLNCFFELVGLDRSKMPQVGVAEYLDGTISVGVKMTTFCLISNENGNVIFRYPVEISSIEELKEYVEKVYYKEVGSILEETKKFKEKVSKLGISLENAMAVRGMFLSDEAESELIKESNQ